VFFSRKARLLAYSRALRASQTDAEVLLWRHLRSRRFADAKFRRQRRLGEFIVDFICLDARLVIELDGGGHSSEEQLLYDRRRTEALERRGLRVLRFWNNDVLTNCDGVLAAIADALEDSRG
jgi:very-short-patch-repair endonuclease